MLKLNLFTLAMMVLTVWQQRRAERMAAVRPEEPGPAEPPRPAFAERATA